MLKHCRDRNNGHIISACESNHFLKTDAEIGDTAGYCGFRVYFAGLDNLNCKTGFFKITVCFCYKDSSMVGVRDPIQYERNRGKFLICVASAGNGYQRCDRQYDD